MSKVSTIIDSLSHKASLLKELNGKSVAEKTEIMLRETRDEVLSKNASDAIKARVTPQIKNTDSNIIKTAKTFLKNAGYTENAINEFSPQDLFMIGTRKNKLDTFIELHKSDKTIKYDDLRNLITETFGGIQYFEMFLSDAQKAFADNVKLGKIRGDEIWDTWQQYIELNHFIKIVKKDLLNSL